MQKEEDKNKVEDEIIVNFALLYGGFIIIFGFLGFYWWTVVRRWSYKIIDQVQPYNRNGGYGSGRM